MIMGKLAIDFEYHAAPNGTIEHLICCVLCDKDGKEARYWLRDGRDTAKLIRHLKAFRTRFVFVAHAMELAEAQCFKLLGLDPTTFRWRDTWLESYILSNSFFTNPRENCSLAECLAKYCDIQIDLEYKKECRSYCILDKTEGHEDDILDYCASDVKYLHTLADTILRMYAQLIKNGFAIHRDCNFSEESLVDLAYVVNCSSEIASRGLPVDVETCEKLKAKVPQMLMTLKREFNDKYDGTFAFSKFKGAEKATKKLNSIYSWLEAFIKEKKLDKEWPRTANGSPSTDSKLLKDFKNIKGFAGDLYHLNKACTSVQGLVKDKDPWLANLVDGRLMYRSLRPMSSSTGRCQPKISQGFIPGFAHFLYCMLNPKPGKVLMEIDYHAEETALQAVICKDPKYAEVYNARDTYLWMAWQLGQISTDQYNADPGNDKKWKESLGDIRGPMKTFTLAWSYGAGFRHLASLAGIPEAKSERWVHDLNYRVFKEAFKWKSGLVAATAPTSIKYQTICFPDAFMCRTIRYKGETPKSDTVKMNFPFQGFGAYLLRVLIKKCHEQGLPAIATIHDAILFEIDEGDQQMVDKCFKTMTDTAKELLGSDLLQCGAPVFWRNHTLSDILDADLQSPKEKGISEDDERYAEACQQYAENVKAFKAKVGDLVELKDVVQFQKFMRENSEK